MRKIIVLDHKARLLGQCFNAVCQTDEGAKFSFLKFWRKRETAAGNLSYYVFTWKPFVPSKRLFCTTWSTWNNRKTLNLTQSSALMWSFRCSRRRSFLMSLFPRFQSFRVGAGVFDHRNMNSRRLVNSYASMSSFFWWCLYKLLLRRPWPKWNPYDSTWWYTCHTVCSTTVVAKLVRQ